MQQDFNGYEVIVVDQTPAYPAVVQQRLDSVIGRIRYYRLGYPNISVARNLGIKVAKAQIINFLDDDAIIPKDYLASHYLSFVNANDKIAGIMGLNIDCEHDNEQGALDMAKGRFGALGGIELGGTVAVQWLQGCNVSYRRKVLLEVGMFDEYLISFCEDMDISVRIRNIGYQLLLDTKISAFHFILSYGGNRGYPKARRFISYNYCVLKNWRIAGIWRTLKILLKEYRYHAFCISVIRKGPREWLKRNLSYIRLMRAVILDLARKKRESQG